MKYVATNLAPWVKSGEIAETPQMFALVVVTVNGRHHASFIKEYLDDALREAKRCFSQNFGRSDGKRTVWKKVSESS